MSRKRLAGVNLDAIARSLDVSISTASRALRDAPGIHPGTRAKILEAARTLGYVIPMRRAELEKPRTILALAPCGTMSTEQRYMAGMSSASISLNLALLSHHVQADECASVLDSAFQPPALRAGMVDGLVLIHRWPPEVARRLSEKYPTVSIIHHYPESSIDLVGIDERSGMASLVRHLHAGGHGHIGYFGLCREMSWSCSRFGAYVEAHVSLGLSYDPQQTVLIHLSEAQSPVPFPDGPWCETVMQRIKQGVRAWVCSSSMTGYTLSRFLLERGLRIPEDVAITGFHTAVGPPAGLPELTATDAVDEELGAAALRRLDYRLRYPHEGNRSILLPANFVQGATTRPTPLSS